MTQIINLNKARKSNAKGKKEKLAAENRVKFGRSKQEKELEKAKALNAKKLIDAHKRSDKPEKD